MAEKLKEYQVLDIFCSGTFYKVRHKVTNSIFAWKAYNCSTFSDEQIQNVDNEVKILSKVLSGNFLRYYDTILHGPTKTLYFVLEYNSWQSVQELIAQSKATDKHFTERFIWYLLLELARLFKSVEDYNFVTLKKCVTTESIFVGQNAELRINCFELSLESSQSSDLMQQVGEIIRILCYLPGACDDKIKEFRYSDDLRDVISFLIDERNSNLRPDVVLYHPTVLANTDTLTGPKNLTEILYSEEISVLTSEANKCDSEKAVDQCRIIEPLPRTRINAKDSPIYCNLSPKWAFDREIEQCESPVEAISPTIAALALELPGYVPRSRQPYSEALEVYNGAQKVSEDTLSHQWMSRLIALRQREESLNERERNIIAKEIVNSPSTKLISLNDSTDLNVRSNGITLPPVINQVSEDGNNWVSRRRHRRSSSLRPKARRKSYAYEDLDSSLSADNGDSSMIVTAAKITKDNMPRRNIFPDVSTKKVHFTASNPFVESDESVTLTFYELENVDKEGYQVPRREETGLKDIKKFKYLDLEKVSSEKRASMQWNQSSPSKQAKMSGKVFSDITNSNLRKTPSKTSLTSKSSNFSRSSIRSSRSIWSCDTGKVGEDNYKERSHSSVKLSYMQTPTAPPELKKSKRKSLLPFKTPFKFKTSTKV
ncbi:unnamed protein product, partial [Brenthis ino]